MMPFYWDTEGSVTVPIPRQMATSVKMLPFIDPAQNF